MIQKEKRSYKSTDGKKGIKAASIIDVDEAILKSSIDGSTSTNKVEKLWFVKPEVLEKEFKKAKKSDVGGWRYGKL